MGELAGVNNVGQGGQMLHGEFVIEFSRTRRRTLIIDGVDHLPTGEDDVATLSASQDFRDRRAAAAQHLVYAPRLALPTLPAELRADDEPVDMPVLLTPLTDPKLIND